MTPMISGWTSWTFALIVLLGGSGRRYAVHAADGDDVDAPKISPLYPIDHGKALMEWLRNAEGGFFHPSLELRRQGDTPFFGMYATERIPSGDLLIEIPNELLFPRAGYQVGDRVTQMFDEGPVEGVVVAAYDGYYDVDFDDGDENKEIPESELYYAKGGKPEICITVNRLVEEMVLGDESFYGPYVKYLSSQPVGQLPSAWTPAGKAALLELLGTSLGGPELLPPEEPLGHLQEYFTSCDMSGPVYEHAYLLVTQRGWDEVMIPIYDMMSHGNGRLLNTESNSVHDDEPVKVHAARAIEAGEEIYTTYNFCRDCDARVLSYGTPEILRDYGFVEKYPQRWVFHQQEVIFDVDYEENEDGSISDRLVLDWVEDHVMRPEHIPFFYEQLIRLESLNEALFTTRDPDITDHEWSVLLEYQSCMVTAIRLALNHANAESSSTCVSGSCVVQTTRYDALREDRVEFWEDSRPETCNETAFGSDFWETIEVVESQYQTIEYLENPTYEPHDFCFALDDVWQICTSYRPHYHEMVVHFTAGFLAEVKRVLFVGGGDSMLLHDILKYPSIEKVVGLEIDQQVTRGAFKYFGVHPHYENDKVEWWFGDAAKSMLMVPKEYYGSFDMVLVDLSETVTSLSVTKGLDVLTALSLLVKHDGILVKNEYPYFPKQKEVFRHTLHAHYYYTHVVCSQSLMLGSHGIDFLRGPYKDHGVHHIFGLLDKPHMRFEVSRDYQFNSTNPQKYCIDSQHYQETPTVQDSSPGITMILEVENTSVDFKSSESLKGMVEAALLTENLHVLSTIILAQGQKPVSVTIMREGYVIARAFPERQYCAYDIHLWGSFEKHEVLKKALVTALGSNEIAPSTSSYRIVTGGMFGVSTWKNDEKNRGPKLGKCEKDEKTSDANVGAGGSLGESELAILVKESLELVLDDNDLVVAVICGASDKPCNALNDVRLSSKVTEVIPVYPCATVVGDSIYTENGHIAMMECEKATWKYLDASVTQTQKKIRAVVLDTRAERNFVSIVHTICRSPIGKRRFFASNLLVAAPYLDVKQRWRKVFVDSFRKHIFSAEPSFKSDVTFRSNNGGDSVSLSISSSGDALFFEHLVQMVDKVEKQANLAAIVDNIRGGDFAFHNPFVANQTFTDADFDRETQLKQWESQKPLGLQSIIQLERVKQRLAITGPKIKAAIMQALIECLRDSTNSVLREFSEVGDGSVFVALWSEGNAVIQWDGRGHIDINLFTYEEDFDFANKFESVFTGQIIGIRRVLRDIQPRGIGTVVNFAKDLAQVTKPRWI